MKSLKTRLIASFSVLILIAIISIGVISLVSSGQGLRNEAENALGTISFEAARFTKSEVETQLKAMEIMAMNESVSSMEWDLQQPFLQEYVENTDFLDLAVVMPGGSAFYSGGNTANLGDREYVRRAFEGEPNVSDLIVSKVTGDVVLMYASPIINNGEIVGALIGRREGTVLSDIAENVRYGINGYGYIINKDGTVVAHPDRQLVMDVFTPKENLAQEPSLESLASLFATIAQQGEGVDDYTYQGRDMFAGFSPIEGTDWFFVITANSEEVLAGVDKMQSMILFAALIVIAIGVSIVFIMGNSITKPIIQMAAISERVADLDLTTRIDRGYLEKSDEVGDLARSMDNLTNSLIAFVSNVAEASGLVSNSSSELMASSQESAATAEEVTKSIEDIASGASNQAKDVEKGSEKASELGESIDRNQTYIMNMNQATEKVKEYVGEGLIEIEKLNEITEENERSTGEIYDVIIKTNKSAEGIESASEVISSIADQTNLLALNAAIEAARAGEAGRGFAVVAEEIRKLAEKSSESTSEIDSIVKQLQSNSKEAVDTISRVRAISKEQLDSAHSNREKYGLINEAMESAAIAVSELNDSGKEMEAIKNEILDVLQALSAIAQENSAATEEVSASMEEQSASVEQIAGSSSELTRLAKELMEQISAFKYNTHLSKD